MFSVYYQCIINILHEIVYIASPLQLRIIGKDLSAFLFLTLSVCGIAAVV